MNTACSIVFFVISWVLVSTITYCVGAKLFGNPVPKKEKPTGVFLCCFCKHLGNYPVCKEAYKNALTGEGYNVNWGKTEQDVVLCCPRFCYHNFNSL